MSSHGANGAGSARTHSPVAGAKEGAAYDQPASSENYGDEGEQAEEEPQIVLRVEPLPQQNASPADIDKGLHLIQLCRDGELETIKTQILEGAPAGFVTKSGWTPIAAAAYSGKCDIVLYLLEIGADTMYQTHKSHSNQYSDSMLIQSSKFHDHGGGGSSYHGSSGGNNKKAYGTNTPLHWACYQGHAAIVSVLIHAGYSIEDTDPIGNRCLHLACSGGYKDVIEILLAHSATVDQKNKYGNRPLDMTTDPTCRKLLHKFQTQTSCEWCKETFSRIRRPSLCQHCHNVYCDIKPCSAVSDLVQPVAETSTTTTFVRAVRYCQDCANDMGKAELDLRNILQSKLDLIQNALASLTTGDPNDPAAGNEVRPGSTTSMAGGEHSDAGSSSDTRPPTTVDGSNSSAASPGQTPEVDVDTAMSDSNQANGFTDDALTDSDKLEASTRIFTTEEIFQALTLSHTDAESLYTAIEAAQVKSADRQLIEEARVTYHRLVAHVALQEEVKALMVVRPIGVRSLIQPLLQAYEYAQQEHVDDKLIRLAKQVVRSAEAECTLFGCNALCSKIVLGTKTHMRDISRLDASIDEAQALGVNDKLLQSATNLRDRLHAEINLETCLVPFEVIKHEPTPELGGVELTTYVFNDGHEVSTLLQALEVRTQRITAAVEAGAAIEGVSSALLEEGGNLLKQLKKEMRDEMRAEDERRRLEEEAALKAAKKGKKKKA
ncbi:TPA: hypothetical protein N0F65_008941 [Lagenidium giganteum]|uniref:FYVE-type domain-containing protein n=1 Tax=Lagenidium giganteum TaxID=4803 RepID=A0AAV2YY87_9STRA|nr:TPA: hypothetical protein N0F65_008941 [Lagenidium giganteum]